MRKMPLDVVLVWSWEDASSNVGTCLCVVCFSKAQRCFCLYVYGAWTNRFDSHLPPKFILFQLLEMPPFKLERNWTSEEDRLSKRQQWLTYVTLYAEERICASCWASQFEEYLDKNLSKNWCMVVWRISKMLWLGTDGVSCFVMRHSMAFWNISAHSRCCYRALLCTSFDCRCESDPAPSAPSTSNSNKDASDSADSAESN